MKTIGKYTLLFFLFSTVLLSLNACRDDDDDDGGNTNGLHLKAKIDGREYSSYVEPTAIVTAGMLNLQSSDSSGNSIQFQIPNYSGAGTYNSGGNNLLNGYINYSKMVSVGNIVAYTSVRGSGKIIITEASATQIKGTFTATAFENVSGSSNKVEITEGTFTAKIQ